MQLFTHHVVREDGQFLFGFSSREELALFEMLISVSGVGPRAALQNLKPKMLLRHRLRMTPRTDRTGG